MECKDVVDIDVTAEDFITRMTNYCTYLPNEKVLPKESLLYQRYMLLEELSQIRIDGRKLSKEDRKAIINDLFIGKGRVKVSDKDFKEYLNKVNYVKVNGKGYDVTGYQSDDGFACALSSYNKFRRILGHIDEQNEKMIEDIIYWITVFEDKDIVKRKINKQYADRLSAEQLKKILKLKFKGWGRYSSKLLNGIKGDMGTTIIEMLEDADERFAYCDYCPNFMQIINKDEKIKQIIDDNRPRYDGTKDLLDVIQDMHTSPANRRGIWQTMKAIEEIIEYMGEKPQQIYIEFAREDDPKAKNKRADSRKRAIDKALKKLKEDVVDEYNEKVYKELKQYEKRLDEEKVYLYFMQNGKSLYTGKELNLNEPENLEIDHIIPYSLSDDDSLDNKALVLKKENQNKGNNILTIPVCFLIITAEFTKRCKPVYSIIVLCIFIIFTPYSSILGIIKLFLQTWIILLYIQSYDISKICIVCVMIIIHIPVFIKHTIIFIFYPESIIIFFLICKHFPDTCA